MPIINMVYKKKKGWKPGANTIAYYPLTDNANDYSGNGYNGTAGSGVSFTNMGTLKYASFNGTSNGKISLPGYGTPSALTTSIWIKSTVTGTGKIFWGLTSPSNNANLYFSIENGNIALTMWNGSSDNRVTGSTINDGNWHNVIGVFGGGELKIYVDGTYISNTSTSVSALNNNNGAIGGWVSGNGIVCSLSENIIENKMWTATNVTNYYNSVKDKYEIPYSYDFTTGTISDFSSFGWSVPSECSMSSNGLTSSGTWSTLDLSNAIGLNSDLQNAKKVTMELVWYRTVTNRGEHAFSLMNGNTEVNVFYGNGTNTQIKVGGTNVLNMNQSQATNTPHTMKSVCDLVNKSASYEDTGVPITGTATLSDTQISNIRDCNGLRLVVQTGVYIKSFSIKIE